MTFKRFSLFVICLILILSACNLPKPMQPSLSVIETETAEPASNTEAIPTSSPIPVEPTATLPPGPRAFTEGFDTSSPYWIFMQVDNGQPAVSPDMQGGFLTFNMPASNQWVYAFYGGADYTDVRVDANVEVQSGDDGAVGIVCRYSQADGWYEFNIYPDQTYVLLYGQWLAGDVVRYTPLYRSTSEKIKSGTNELGLICQGNTLTPFINSVQMRIWQETKFNLKDGEIGVSAASFASVPFAAAYDWVKVSEP